MEFTESQIALAGRVLSDRAAADCGVDKDDNWNIYGRNYRDDAKAVLAAIAAAPQVVADERAAWPIPCDVKVGSGTIKKGSSFGAVVARMNVLHDMAMKAAAPVQAQEPVAVVYPPDGTVSPFTVINLGHGLVKMGDSLHDGRLPALWFGKDGLGMGVAEEMNRAAKEGETLAVVTFANVEGLDVLSEVVRRIRSASFPGAPVQPVAVPDVDAPGYKPQAEETVFYSRLGLSDDGLPFMTDSSVNGTWDIAMVFEKGGKRPSKFFSMHDYLAAPAAQGDAKELTPTQIIELAKQSGFSVDASGHIKVAALNGGCTAQVMRLARAAIAAKAVKP